MTPAIVVIGAIGVALIVTGLPPVRRVTLSARIDPYLVGLKGRPSGLLARAGGRSRTGAEIWAAELWRRWGVGSDDAVAGRLLAAGDDRSVAAFRLDQLVWAGTAVVAVWGAAIAATALGVVVDAASVPALSAVALVGGVLGRDRMLTVKIERRREILQQELPTAIDLMALAVMAGESIAAAMERVGSLLDGEIGDEFGRVISDVRGGAPLIEALEALKTRVDMPEIARLVDALVTAIERGTPVVEVLRVQADDGREARRRLLMESGGRREVLMLVPVVFLIMPVVIVFALYPGLVSLDLLVP